MTADGEEPLSPLPAVVGGARFGPGGEELEKSPLERLPPLWRNAVLALLLGLAGWFLWSVRSALNPLIFGYLLAFIAAPVVRALKRRGFSHGSAVALIFVSAGLGTILLSGSLAYQGWQLASEIVGPEVPGQPGGTNLFVRIEDRILEGVSYAEGKLEEWGVLVEPSEDEAGEPGLEDAEGQTAPPETAASAATPPVQGPPAPGDELEPELTLMGELNRLARTWLGAEGVLGRAGQTGMRWTGNFVSFLLRLFDSMFGFATFLLLLPVYTYFLLFQLDTIHGFVRRHLPRRDRPRIVRVGSQIGEVISNFFRGRLLVSLLKGLFTAAGLAVLGIPYALLFGLLGGFLSLVPFVGPLLAFAMAFLIGLTEFSLFGSLWRTALVFMLAEGFEGYVLLPKILGESLGLHPVVVLASITIGAAALGFFGMLIALPLAASFVILAREFVMPALAAWADEN